MILHYANLCVVAGGVDLFVIGSELRGLETIRGPGWTKAGTTDGSGYAVWDYPFVAGLETLADDVRGVFDGAGPDQEPVDAEKPRHLFGRLVELDGLSAPGRERPVAASRSALGPLEHRFRRLRQLSAADRLDDRDGRGRRDGELARARAVRRMAAVAGDDERPWPVPAFRRSTRPPISRPNIEGGQYFNWFYNDGDNLGRGFDPNGSALTVSLPRGDRLAQARNPYYPGQRSSRRSSCAGGGTIRTTRSMTPAPGWAPHGPQTEWQAQSKSITMLEYGFSAVDKATNQPNVFFDAKSTESATPFWSIWDPAPGLATCRGATTRSQALALEAIYEYWNVDGNNATTGAASSWSNSRSPASGTGTRGRSRPSRR